MIMKGFVVAKDYSLIGAKILRDHGSIPDSMAWYVAAAVNGAAGVCAAVATGSGWNASAAGPTDGLAALRGLLLDVEADYLWT
jgi:hypothetical protein